jgi:hypothetical protein
MSIFATKYVIFKGNSQGKLIEPAKEETYIRLHDHKLKTHRSKLNKDMQAYN